MDKPLNTVSDYVGSIGVLICAVAGGARLLGQYAIGGFEMLTLFEIGVGIIVTACFAKLYLLTRTAA